MSHWENARERERFIGNKASNRELLESRGKKQGEVWNERQMPKWVPVFNLAKSWPIPFPREGPHFIEERERTVSPHLRHHMFRETVKFSNRYQAFFYAYQLGLIKDAPLLSHPHTSSSKSHSSVQIRSMLFFLTCQGLKDLIDIPILFPYSWTI